MRQKYTTVLVLLTAAVLTLACVLFALVQQRGGGLSTGTFGMAFRITMQIHGFLTDPRARLLPGRGFCARVWRRRTDEQGGRA